MPPAERADADTSTDAAAMAQVRPMRRLFSMTVTGSPMMTDTARCW